MSRRPRRKASTSTSGMLENWLFKVGTKLFLSLVVVLVALSLMQCTIKKPESPVWNTQLTIPLINRTYTMPEIIEKIDQEGLSIDPDSSVVFSMTREIDTVRLDDDEMTTADLSYMAFESIGQVALPAPVIQPVVLDIMLISGLATYLPGTVPATSFSITSNLPRVTTYTSIGLTSGQAWVIVANNLGFEITANSVELWDVTYNRSIGSQVFPTPIPDGGIDSVLYDLSGQTLSNLIQARISAVTPGGTVLSTSGKNIITTMRFDGDLTVAAATAEIPALNRSFSQNLALGESDVIYQATLLSGNLHVEIGNQTNLTAGLDITFPDLRYNGSPLTIQRTIGPIGSSIVNINLAGYELTPTDSTLPQEVRVEVEASVPASAPQHVTIDQSQQFIVEAGLSNLAFGSVTGIFSTVGTTVEPTEYELDVPAGLDSAQLVSAVVTLEIENGVELPGMLALTLLGNNGKTLVISGPVTPGTPTSPVVTQFIDSTVADFLSPMPSLITISGSASFGDGVNVGTIRTGDYVWASFDVFTPFEVILPRTLVEPDVESEELDQDDLDAITDHVVEARLLYNVINHLPIGATINVFLSGDSSTVLTDPEVSFIDEIFVVAAPTVGSIVSDTVSTGYQEVIIDSVDVQVLKNDRLYIGTQIVLDDTNGQPVKLMASDYLSLIARIEVDYRFDGEF